ncbi:MAG: hypothetical protein LBJ10_07935 [Clostridiales bacterium]|jgi:hypothetical protein|nr:hypothetical protein [Clostridiales bacterium]
MTDKLEKYMALHGKDETKGERRKLLESMDNDEINQLIESCGNQTARAFYAQFRK